MLFFAGRRKDGRAMRKRLLATIEDDPGVHVSELAQTLGVAWHTVAYHLGVLAEEGRISVDKGGRERRVSRPTRRRASAAGWRPRGMRTPPRSCACWSTIRA